MSSAAVALSPEEAATELGKSVRQIRYMMQEGRLPARKLDGRWPGHKCWEVMDAREPSRFVGYRRAGTVPGPQVKRRLKKRLRAAAERGPDALARSLASYGGVFLF